MAARQGRLDEMAAQKTRATDNEDSHDFTFRNCCQIAVSGGSTIMHTAAIEFPVQRDCSIDQRQVRECLRKVADLFPGEGDFF